ncbi:MAG: redoxin domain-containing protein [Planctomycetes bacterium]|nr:redoxin domain-containing protein [Planctomycetota bacterium]
MTRCMLLLLLCAFSVAQEPVKPVEAVPPAPVPVTQPEKSAAPVKVVKLAAGDMLPEFTLADLAGGTKTSKDLLKGKKILVLDFWSASCPTCKVNESRFTTYDKDWAEKGVVIVHIASNRGEVGDAQALDKLREAVKANGIKLPILVDTGNVVADTFGAAVTPTTYVIDATGKIRYSGAITDDSRNRKVTVDYIGDALSALLADKEPGITSSRPEG